MNRFVVQSGGLPVLSPFIDGYTRQSREAVVADACVLLGSNPIQDSGANFDSTILTSVTRDNPT